MTTEDSKFKKTTDSALKAAKAITSMGEAVDRLSRLGSDSAKPVGDMTSAFEDLAKSAENFVDAGKNSLGFITTLMSTGPLVGEGFEGLGKGIGVVGDAFSDFISIGDAGLKAAFDFFDAPSRDVRSFASGIFDLNKKFGGTIEQAFKFGEALRKETYSQFGETLHLTRDKLKAFADASAGTNVTLEQLNKTVGTGLGDTSLLAAAWSLAAASGLTANEGMGLLSTALNKQGKSAQDALEMMAMFGGVSMETGLSIRSVSETLNSAVSGFTKLGISADFGVPLMQGFARVMNDMGLGIENATDLTAGLSSSLASLTTDYANAYLIFQRGGLDIGGGGGVLSSSIGLQAAVLEAEKTGSQADLGAELAKGMRDTLASFTGGDIVTVSQAAESPGLEKDFFMQQKLLVNQFGIKDEASANRTLELLADLDDATRSGDLDAKALLEEQIAKEKDGRDQTLDKLELSNRHLAAQSNWLAVIASETLLKQRGGAELLRDKLEEMVDVGSKAARDGVGTYAAGVDRLLGVIGAGPDGTGAASVLGAETDAGKVDRNTQQNLATPPSGDPGGGSSGPTTDDLAAALRAFTDSNKNNKNVVVDVRMTEELKNLLAISASLGQQVTENH